MKVLHIIPSIAPRYGGTSEAVIAICRALQSEQLEVVIATTDADGNGRLPVGVGTQTKYQGIPTIFFPRQFSESFKYSSDLAGWANKHVKNFDVAHIHAVFSHSSITAAGACIRNDIPYIVQPHGSLDPWSLQRRRFAKAILWYLGVKRMLDGAAAVQYTSKQERRLAEDGLRINSGVVVPLGVSQNIAIGESFDFRAVFPVLEDSPYVLLLSRIHEKKNIELLIKDFSYLRNSSDYAHWKLAIAGDGDPKYVERLKKLAQDSCGDSVIFTGWLEGAEKAAAFKETALFVLPSHQENFGLSMVEAMVNGVPVLVSNRVNLSDEIAAAGAGWVVDLERGSLRQTLSEAMSDEEGRATRGAAAQTLACSRYNWAVVAKELVGLYRQVQSTKRHTTG